MTATTVLTRDGPKVVVHMEEEKATPTADTVDRTALGLSNSTVLARADPTPIGPPTSKAKPTFKSIYTTAPTEEGKHPTKKFSTSEALNLFAL